METLLQTLPTWITFSPLLGVILLLFIPRTRSGLLKGVGMLATLPPLALALLLFVQFDGTLDKIQFAQKVDWFTLTLSKESGVIGSFTYNMGIDGLSMPLIVLAAIIFSLSAIASMYIKERHKEYFVLFLLLEVGVLGVFMAHNLLLFFLFFEITLVATFFLIGIWGYLSREKAANQFLLYNGIGSAVMLIAFIVLFFITQTMDFAELKAILANPDFLQWIKEADLGWLLWSTLIGLLIAFGVKLPIFPFHSWMLRVHVEAPPSIVMLHSGVMLKMGAYGLLRFGVELFPTYVKEIATLLAILGLVNILYGAILAFRQRDLKRVLAYSSISHMGFILFGIASLNVIGLQGAVFQAVSHGFISALLFFIIATLYERTKTTMIDELGGLSQVMPILSGIFLAAGLALLGLPGMSGFISELLAFLGLFDRAPVIAVIGALGLILAAVYALRAVLSTTFGALATEWKDLKDTRIVETLPMLLLLGLIIGVGIYPSVLSDPMQATLQMIASRMGG